MKFRNLVVAAAGALFLALTSFAQITAIEGDVRGEDGNPKVGALVKITRTDIKGSYKCNTNKKGHYFYNGLPLGTYNIAVEVDGKEMDGVNGVRTRLGDPVPVNFDLQKIAQQRSAKAAAATAAAASGTAPVLSKEQERGMTKEQKEAYDKAIKDREASMKKNKELNDAFTAGLAAVQAKDWDTAVTNLAKASELDPKQVAVWAQLADAYVGAASKQTGADFDATLAKGIDAYGKAIELNPSDAATHNNFALALAQGQEVPRDAGRTAEGRGTPIRPRPANTTTTSAPSWSTPGRPNPPAPLSRRRSNSTPNHADSYYQYGVYLVGKASFAADGKVTPVPGTVEAFQKYLQLAPNGQFAESAKGMLASMDAKVDTNYKNPNAPAPKKKK